MGGFPPILALSPVKENVAPVGCHSAVWKCQSLAEQSNNAELVVRGVFFSGFLTGSDELLEPRHVPGVVVKRRECSPTLGWPGYHDSPSENWEADQLRPRWITALVGDLTITSSVPKNETGAQLDIDTYTAGLGCNHRKLGRRIQGA